MQLIDSHCHIPLIDSGDDGVTGVIDRANHAAVTHMLCVCVDLETFPDVDTLARSRRNIFSSVGVHPNSGTDSREPSIDDLAVRADAESVVAIGETGLDYYRSVGGLDWQRERFRVHIRAAREVGKPLIVHCREASIDVINILREEHAEEVGGVMHCFVEDLATAHRAMELGFYISLSGIVTFKNADRLQMVARQLPSECLLIETDSPWLAPVPYRGKQNEPAYVREIAEFIARLRDENLDDLASYTTRNFFRLFKIGT
jgi:TatD DNase family protein